MYVFRYTKNRTYDHFFHAPIADDNTKDTSYDKYFEYDIIYADKLNKSDLLKEKFNDTFILQSILSLWTSRKQFKNTL